MENYGRLISTGKICSVYLIEDPDIGIKRIAKIFGKESYEYFCIEKEILQKYRIINFPGYISSFCENEKHHLIVEFIDGKTIYDKVAENGTFSQDEAAHILKLVVAAVQRFYSVAGGRFVFCDLSPANIIIRDDGEISIIDLNGVSRKGDRYRTATLGFTDNAGFGSDCTGDMTDIYSAGKLYCYMLTGKTGPDAIKCLNRRNAEIVSGCTLKRNIGNFDSLLKTLDDSKRDKELQVLFKRKICTVGDGEFALELAYALANMGYRVFLDDSGARSDILEYCRRYCAGEEILKARNADIEIRYLNSTADIGADKFHKIFRTLKALTYEIENALGNNLLETDDLYLIFFKYDGRCMLPDEYMRKALPAEKYLFIPETRRRKISYETDYFKYIKGFKADKYYMKVINLILGVQRQ